MEPLGTRLVGRDAELAQLRAFVAEAAGDGGALLVAGEAGVGKSVLLDVAATAAAAAGTTVVRGAGVEFEAEVGFAGLHQLIQPLLDDVGSLPAPQSRALGVALGLEDSDT
ncbi:MAG TPA: ATP-binding protein, partial [Nocardioides sp.]|nr:ATP-binding protein [Nocardioides sp.]